MAKDAARAAGFFGMRNANFARESRAGWPRLCAAAGLPWLPCRTRESRRCSACRAKNCCARCVFCFPMAGSLVGAAAGLAVQDSWRNGIAEGVLPADRGTPQMRRDAMSDEAVRARRLSAQSCVDRSCEQSAMRVCPRFFTRRRRRRIRGCGGRRLRRGG